MNIKTSSLNKFIFIHCVLLPLTVCASIGSNSVLLPQADIKIFNNSNYYTISESNDIVALNTVSSGSSKSKKANRSKSNSNKQVNKLLRVSNSSYTKVKKNTLTKTSKSMINNIKKNPKQELSRGTKLKIIKNKSMDITRPKSLTSNVTSSSKHKVKTVNKPVSNKARVAKSNVSRGSKVYKSGQPDLSYISKLVSKKSVSKGMTITSIDDDLNKVRQTSIDIKAIKQKNSRFNKTINRADAKKHNVNLPTDYIKRNDKKMKQQLKNIKLKEEILLLNAELENAKKELLKTPFKKAI